MSIPTFKNILYATDLGSKMRPVFRHAISLAQHYQANVIMLHIAEPLGDTGKAVLELYMPDKLAGFEKNDMKLILGKMKQRLEDFYHDELGNESHLVSDVVVVSGHPAEEIAKFAAEKNVDLIVVGTHTGEGFGARMLGSTARKLVHISELPVLVVPIID